MGLLRPDDPESIGDYVIERKLGAGGMAEVYLARKTGPRGFSKRVAIKRILPELSEDSQLIQMFCDEARVAGTLSHPNISQVIEFGEQAGEFYIVMEYVDGVSFSTVLRAASSRGETVPPSAALYVVRDVLLALACAHEAVDESGVPLGIVHRDVSPSNVLVSRTGTVKLIDFGITRSRIAERKTYPGELKGKLRYMSPEQILGVEVDARSDLFAAGVVLAEMLAGKALFSGKSDLDVLTRISRGDLGALREGRIPGDLVPILERALAHRPGDRFQSAREFARAIEDVAAVRGVRLDDTTIVPFLHALGVLPSSSGTRESPVAPPVPSASTQEEARPAQPSVSRLPRREGFRKRMPSGRPTVQPPRRRDSATPAAPADLSARLAAECHPTGPPPSELLAPPSVPRSSRGADREDPRASGAYRVRTKSGQVVGPLSRTEMLALLATGRLSARSHVSLKSDQFVTVEDVPALASLASHPAYRFREDDQASPEWLERIESATIPTTLYRLAASRATGLLVAVDGKRRKRVFLEQGNPVFVASTDRDELLGRRLVAARVVSERAVKLALASQPPFRLGEALVSFGALGAAHLVRELARQLEDRVSELGAWRKGELRFFSAATLDEGYHVRTREPTLTVLTRLVRDQYPPGDIASLLRPFTKEPVGHGPGAREAAADMGLTTEERAVIDLALRGGVTVRDVVTRGTQSGVAMADALRAVFVGLCSGLLIVEGWPRQTARTLAG
ncbi:MAG TPA: protein kinase [Polyangiaceae bacterium]|nr:protein kinase [Polyangiaceae bacterium]